jgi:hypothetical protein
MFIVSFPLNGKQCFLDSECCSTSFKEYAEKFKCEELAIAAKKYCESQWGHDCKILAVQ